MTTGSLPTPIFRLLWNSYVQDARPFFLVHMVLLVIVLAAIVDWIWRGRDATDELATARADFIRGIIGMFLVVGIAGTFYGLFQFAIQTLDKTPGTPMQPVEAALKAAMAKAFPVGFFGLAYTLIFHLTLDAIEFTRTHYKTRAVANRQNPPTYDQIVELLEEARLLRGGLQPIADLGTTIEKGLQPVTLDLHETLAATTRVLEDQGTRLEAGKDALINAAGQIAASAHALTQSAKDVIELTAHAKSAAAAAIEVSERAARSLTLVNRHTATLAKSAGETLTLASGTFKSAADQAATITERLKEIPDALSTKVAEVIKTPVEEGLRRYENAVFTAISSAFAPIQTQLGAVVEKEATMNRSVESTLHNVERSNEKLAALVTQGVHELTGSYKATLDETVGELIETTAAAARDTKSTNAKTTADMELATSETKAALGAITQSATGELERLGQLTVRARKAADEIAVSARRLGDASAEIEAALDRTRATQDMPLVQAIWKSLHRRVF
jgi:hypothetical protein